MSYTNTKQTSFGFSRGTSRLPHWASDKLPQVHLAPCCAIWGDLVSPALAFSRSDELLSSEAGLRFCACRCRGFLDSNRCQNESMGLISTCGKQIDGASLPPITRACKRFHWSSSNLWPLKVDGACAFLGASNRRFAGGAERVFGMSLVLIELEDAIAEERKSLMFQLGRSHGGLNQPGWVIQRCVRLQATALLPCFAGSLTSLRASNQRKLARQRSWWSDSTHARHGLCWWKPRQGAAQISTSPQHSLLGPPRTTVFQALSTTDRCERLVFGF